MVALGLTAPLAASLLALQARAGAGRRSGVPRRRGAAAAARCASCTGRRRPSSIPISSVGVKDMTGSRIFYEPLADFDADGQLVPVLAAEHPEPAERRRVPRRHAVPGPSRRA